MLPTQTIALVCWLQPFGLVLQYVRHIPTLVSCSMVSQHGASLATEAVRANMADLVQHCSLLQQAEVKAQALLWLCSTAGPAVVNTHHGGCAILQLLHGIGSPFYATVELSKTGNTCTHNCPCMHDCAVNLAVQH